MRNIALRLCYDGTAYHGWQKQKTEVTVSETLEKAIHAVTGEEVHVIGCGRTDAGVHAERYCANFRTDTTIPVDRLPFALNTRLPDDISVVGAVDAPWEFNSIGSCIKKEYTYRVYNHPFRDPFWNNRAYFYPYELDIGVMQKAASAFVGTHDFAAVRSVGTDVKSTVRTVYYYEVSQNGDIIEFKICANGFLYNMARAMVGTVIYASRGKISPDEIGAILESGNRCLAGPTVPSGGLYMTHIWYDGEVGRMML